VALAFIGLLSIMVLENLLIIPKFELQKAPTLFKYVSNTFTVMLFASFGLTVLTKREEKQVLTELHGFSFEEL